MGVFDYETSDFILDNYRELKNILTEIEFQILHKCCIEGYQYNEVSAQLELTLPQVRTRLATARKKLEQLRNKHF